jgi:hypothetical protein
MARVNTVCTFLEHVNEPPFSADTDLGYRSASFSIKKMVINSSVDIIKKTMQIWLRFVLCIPFVFTSPINIVLSPGAVYYQDFFNTILSANLPKNTEIFFHREAELSARNDCKVIKSDLVIRGWWNKRTPCPNIPSDVFISSEPWDTSFVAARLLIDCKLSRSLLPPSTSMDILYIPFYSLSFSQRFLHSPFDLLKSSSSTTTSYSKRKFCAFLAKNCMLERLELMRLLNRIDKVDALGSCGSDKATKNSPETTKLSVLGFETVDNFSYLDRAVQAYQEYKFVICVENSRIVGYVTEKIVNAFLAGSIPIYIGAPDIETHFNPKSFINCNRIDMSECVKLVRKVHENETLYNEMRSHASLPGNVLGKGFDWYHDDDDESKTQVETNDDDSETSDQLLTIIRDVFLITKSQLEVEVDDLGLNGFIDVSTHTHGSIIKDDLKKKKVIESLLPDPTFRYWSKTKTIFDPLTAALGACSSHRFPTFQKVYELLDMNHSVRCQIESSDKPSSFVACETYQPNASSFSNFISHMPSILSGTMSNHHGTGRYGPSKHERSSSGSDGGESIKPSADVLLFDTESPALDILLQQPHQQEEKKNRSMGFVIISEDWFGVSSLYHQSDTSPHESNGDDDDDGILLIKQYPPVVFISKIDGVWVKECVDKAIEKGNDADVKFSMLFKPNLNNWIEILSSTFSLPFNNISSSSSSAVAAALLTIEEGKAKERQVEIEDVFLDCMGHVIGMAPTSSKVFEEAARAMQLSNHCMLNEMSELFAERASQLKFY